MAPQAAPHYIPTVFLRCATGVGWRILPLLVEWRTQVRRPVWLRGVGADRVLPIRTSGGFLFKVLWKGASSHRGDKGGMLRFTYLCWAKPRSLGGTSVTKVGLNTSSVPWLRGGDVGVADWFHLSTQSA